MHTNAIAHYPASASEAERPCSRYGQRPLAQCVLCCAGTVLFVCRPRAVWSTLSEVNHQLESRMRETRPSGSEGGGTCVLPSPISYGRAASPLYFSAWSSDDESSSRIHSTIESGKLPFLIKSS